jgi:hypothetical protein
MGRSIAVAAAVLALSACGGKSTPLPEGTKAVKLDPSKFTTQIDNPYWSMKPGDHWVYRELEDGELQRVDVTVTDQTKVLGGVAATGTRRTPKATSGTSARTRRSTRTGR